MDHLKAEVAIRKQHSFKQQKMGSAVPQLRHPLAAIFPPLFNNKHTLSISSLSREQCSSSSVVVRSMTARAISNGKAKDPRLHHIASSIRVVPDFPKPGIMFQDITTLLLDPKAFKDAVDLFVERYRGRNVSVVAGIEARGFFFGPPIALAIGAKFVPLRKPRKLPGEVISEEYILEYGRDCLEMHTGAVQPGDRALVVDDLIATGGTMCAAMKLLERSGAEVVECACVVELPELKGRERLNNKPLYILVESY